MGAGLASFAAAIAASAASSTLGLRPEIQPDAASLGLRGAIPAAASPAPPPDAVLQQASIAPRPARTPPGQDSLLELWVNGRTDHVLARVRGAGPGALVERAALTAAGVAVDPAVVGDFVPLAALGPGRAQVVGPSQQLMLTTPAGGPVQVFDARGAQAWSGGASGGGFIGRYDISALTGPGSAAGGSWSVGGSLSATLFAPWGVVTSTALARASPAIDSFVRLDTAYQYDDPARLQRWVIGDALSSDLRWSRAVRFAGLQFAKDFSLRPEMSTLPLPDFMGSVAAPSTVDVFVDSARVYSADVSPGPFAIRNIPVVTGRGDAVVVVRDALGRDVTTTLPLYVSADLLAKGLSSYAVEVGVLRRSYGLRSFDYGTGMTAGTFRYGATGWLTLEGHAEATRDAQVVGGGGAVALGALGSATAALAGSHSRFGDGGLYAVSAQLQGRRLGLFGSYSGSSGADADIAAAEGAPLPRSRLQLGASYGDPGFGSIAASWISQTGGSGRISLTTVSYTRMLSNGWYFGASAFHSDPGAWSGQVFFRVPLGQDRAASVWGDAHDGRFDPGVSYTRSVNPDGGFGYLVAASADRTQSFQANATWVGSNATVDVGVLSNSAGQWGRALVSGDIVDVDGSVFATRPSDGPFALVRTGQPGVKIYRENREAATTNARGEAMIADLTPYATNRIGVDTASFPITTRLDDEVKAVAPRARSGVVVDFTPKAGRPALLTLRRANGAAPPAGSRVRLADGRELILGRNGEIFLQDLSQPVTGTVIFDGGACRFSAPAAPEAVGDQIPRLGPARCEEAPAHEG